ncbi:MULTISPECIES: molybdate ABC transporter substrate-binding protein [unclassified Desulfovibrio]|uniref:molybdate ABC transporter substrate-binding protein n=1 Tax=unclassified Desulfovibrio TaxID=2593640 RepID=UPI000F5FA721|nr:MULTISPECIES: molybdate ABC transporter substrate-binding protein [unclassified Desulfovibrio]RRD70160.1 molybdate ABC transporter substrate-binding protein [Desulfovibrio sp. OH1209_COT-279]RRD86692.1 molybdate ABC transporter substrate-binding protein [Desulfovibrio sp. OH1186_COT-070]
MKKRFFPRLVMALTCALLLHLPAHAAEVTVSAAASLTNAFTELKNLFEKQYEGLKINVNFAASNPLLKQMQEGAPVDVFASADQATMNKAVEAGLVDAATRKDFARNTLVLIVPAGSGKPGKLADISSLGRIAVGNPDSVPAGRYAREALTSAGLWDGLQARLVMGNSVRQVLDYVARGEVDAGFVYGTDARQMADKVDVVMVAEGHAPVTYPVAVARTGRNAVMGQAFVDFVLSGEGQEVLAKYGFARP